ncbi:hypothetical protein STA3757_03920 [Stanieria sp. NIES-3757]|nr:hypothetical protein STA3757_03920 [Stanieria sp. NIES-3757]
MNNQLSLFSVPEPEINCSGTNVVPDAKTQALLRFLGKSSRDSNGLVEVYSPSRRKSEYFRYMCRRGNRLKHHHIPGGNILDPLAQKRALQIKQMINTNASYLQIVNVIQNF